MIPKILYILHNQLRETFNVSEEWKNMNQEYDIQIYDFYKAKAKLQSMPDVYYQTFKNISSLKIGSDFLKLVLLYEYGGVVIDCDLEPLCGLDTFLEGDVMLCKSMYENKETGYCGKFLASVPRDPFIKQLLYIYTNHFLVNNTHFPVTRELSYVIDKLSVIPDSIKMIQQQGAHFFYDVCYVYDRKRIMNDRAVYFENR